MPLNEASSKPRRQRWPLQFDLEGVPRDTATRKELLKKMKEGTMQPNSFLSDRNAREAAAAANPLAALSPEQKANLLDQLLRDAPTGREIDLSKPVIVPFNPRDPKHAFPRMVFHHDTGHTLTVRDAKQLSAAQKHGYKLEASENWDYSKLPNGYATRKAVNVAAEKVLSTDDLAALDEEEVDA